MTEIGWCPSGRLDELQRFIDAEWAQGHILATDSELLRWQHPRPTADELSVLVSDGDNGELAGILGIIPISFCELGRRRDGAWLTTWVVRPQDRTRQLGLALLRHAIEHTDGLVGTLGGNNTTMGILRVLGFHLRPAVPRWIRPVSADAFAALMTAAGAVGGGAGWSVPRVAPAATNGEITLCELTPETEPAWDGLWHRRLAPGLVGTWRDADYLRWRYLEHPRFCYRVSLAMDAAGDARGLLVDRTQPVRDRDEQVVRIVELLGEPQAQRALLEARLGAIDQDRTAFVDFYCTSDHFAATLDATGFVRDDGRPPVPSLFAPLDARRTELTGAFAAAGTDSDIFAGENVYFTRSDCDQDRPN